VESRGPSPGHDDYLAREAKARVEIDRQLAAAGWKVQSQKALNLGAGPGVAVREFTLEKPHGRVDYLQHVRSLLTINGRAAIVVPDNVLFEGGAGEI
jgi:type I site-specific restriction endonuclease